MRHAPAAAAALLLSTLALAGCALPIQAEMDQASELAVYAAHYQHVVGVQNNLLDRALANCNEKTQKAEAVCVRQAVDAANPSPASLIALVPHCRAGELCHYDHATHDRLGFVEATAANYIKRWRIDLDFRYPAASSSHVPITVMDRDDFESTPPG